MPRLTTLDEVLFPVGEHPVFVSVAEDDGEQRVSVPWKKAVVDGNTRRVLGIVGRDYRLVKNREALDMAHECCRAVFPETKPAEWEAQAVDAPATAAYCHIDLVHKFNTLDFTFAPEAERPDVFGPFIRVTNSYNGLRALGFDIGFYRKICKNGMIAPDSLIRFKFTHSRSDIRKSIQFQVAGERLTKFKTAFADSLASLRNCAVPRSQFEPLIRSALLLQPPQRLRPDDPETDDWWILSAQLAKISTRYASELGENAYAAFNAITEFASHPPDNRCLHRDRHSLQRLAGSWVSSFSAACHTKGFSINDYIEKLEEKRVGITENESGASVRSVHA